MDFRYGIHTIELFHRLSKKSFNKVFQHLKSLNFGKLYPDVTYHSDKGIEKYICTSYCGQGVVLYLYKQKRSKNKTTKILPVLSGFDSIRTLYCTENIHPRRYSKRKKTILKRLTER